jgi:hypothetical protein
MTNHGSFEMLSDLRGSYVIVVASALIGCSTGAKPDKGFDTSVAQPTYTSAPPRVLFDEAHNNYHTIAGRYQPFVRLMRNDGYTVERVSTPFTPEALSGVDILVIAGARGTNERNDAPAFTDAEGDIVREWVRGGGSLLLITDHFPFGPAAQRLGNLFGIGMSGGGVEDSLHHDVTSGDWSQLVFSRGDSLIVDHPITLGRSPTEKITRVMTFMGQSLTGPVGSVGFLRLSSTAVDRSAEVTVERDGGDTRVIVMPGSSTPAAGRAQGLAIEYGRGRIVVLGEAAMLSAQRQNGRSFGMQVPGIDNRQLALNIMHWLSRLI